MGVVIRRWVWLKCIGVVSGWCCKEVDFLILLLIPTPLLLALFCNITTSLFIFKMFFFNLIK